MALNPDILAEQLTLLGDPKNPGFPGAGTLAQAPGRLAEAYDTYAKDAVDSGGNKLIAGNVAAMKAVLAGVFSTSSQSVMVAAQGIGLAHSAYWMGARFATTVPPASPGVGGTGVFSVALNSVVVAAPAEPLELLLASLFAYPTVDGQIQAKDVAQGWHLASQQVLFTTTGLDTTPPPTGPLPLVLQGKVR